MPTPYTRPAPLPHGLIARLVNSVGVNLVEARIRPVAVIVVLEKGLKGAPIDEYLADLEKEFFQIAENSYDKYLQILPLKMMMPLMLLILPGVMLLLIAPLLFTVGRGF